MKETGPIAGIDCENTMTKINCVEGTDDQSITKIFMKESIIVHFRTMEIGENIKIIIKTNIGIKNSMTIVNPIIWIILIVEIGHVTKTGYIIEKDSETTVEVSIKRKDKYKRSRVYYEDVFGNIHGMDKFECQFRNDNYDIIRGRPKEKPCSCGDQSCDSFYSELKKWYSRTIAVDMQDLHNSPTNIVDELELSDIHLIEQYTLDKEEMEAQEMEECIVEL